MNQATGPGNHRILVIDDNPSIHEDIRKILQTPGQDEAAMLDAAALLFGDEAPEIDQTDFSIDSAFQGEEGLRQVRTAADAGQPYALAFVDVRMPPGWDGVETITRIWKEFPDLQVVICTAYSDYSWAGMIRKLGKTDSLVILKKPFDNIEVLQLAHTLTEKWALSHQVKSRLRDLDHLVRERTAELQSANGQLRQEIAERRRTETALRLSEERFSKAFQASPMPMAIQALEREEYVDANLGFERLVGFHRDDLLGRTPGELRLWDYAGGPAAVLTKLRAEMSVRNLAAQLRTRSGEARDVLLSVEMFELDGRPFLLTLAQDITDQTRLENQLRQSQKMEAVGQLAAGVAHDFNNILTVVQGHATLLLNTRPPEDADCRSLRSICAAAERASKLVRQLLTFSRKQVRQARPLAFKEVLTSLPEMFFRLLGEHIKVQVTAAPDLPLINADAAMIEQLLMNLALNARDAMAAGGTLTIAVEAVELGPEVALHSPEARAGQFICLTVADTGCGMPREILPRIFEPFFTTKPVGKGTGLGLASVYGIAKQHEGWVEVRSQVGQGSAVKVYFPAAARGSAPGPGPARAASPPSTGGKETILVVEDEADVRELVVHLLQASGYQVLQSASGIEALALWSQTTVKTDLLLTDMVMPGGVMGRELAERLLRSDPRLRVIYTSGYSPGMAGKDMALLEGRNFLPKPYPPDRLLKMVRECLDR